MKVKDGQVIINISKNIEFNDEKELLKYCAMTIAKRYKEITDFDKEIEERYDKT